MYDGETNNTIVFDDYDEVDLYNMQSAGEVAASGVLINGEKVSIKDFRENNPLIQNIYSWKKLNRELDMME